MDLTRYEKTNIHYHLASISSYSLHQYYYKPSIIRFGRTIHELFFHHHEFIFKPEYLNYLLFYHIYAISHFWTNKHFILLNLHLHSFYIIYLLEKILCEHYKYVPIVDRNWLKNIAFIFYYYVIYFKIHFSKRGLGENVYLEQIMAFTGISTYSLLMNIHYAYTKRLESIEENREDGYRPNSFYKILVVTPNVKTIQKIVYHTRHFTFSNFLIFLSCILYFIL